MLRLEGRGPLSPVHALAFGANGATLYEAGWDKVVRVWRRDAATAGSPSTRPPPCAVPIGPGDAGVLNALAVSADGAWLAVAGTGSSPKGAGFRQIGLVVPRGNVADPLAQGVIYVFDLRANPPQCRAARGASGARLLHSRSPPPRRAGRPCSSPPAEEPDPGDPRRRDWCFACGTLSARTELDRPAGGELPGIRPWLAAWSVAPDHARIRVAAAWSGSSFLVWDVGRRATEAGRRPAYAGRKG